MAKLKSITVRANKEVLPFQHARIEMHYTLGKEDDDVNSIKHALSRDAADALDAVVSAIFPTVTRGATTSPVKQKDNIPY